MTTYDLYGFKGLAILEAKSEIEEKLEFYFEERESSYQGGGYYKFVSDDSEIFVLKGNVDPFDGEPVEQMCSGYPVLLYVDMTLRSEEIKSLLSAGFDLLRHELFD